MLQVNLIDLKSISKTNQNLMKTLDLATQVCKKKFYTSSIEIKLIGVIDLDVHIEY